MGVVLCVCVQDGWTALMKAARYGGRSEVCTQLLTFKAQPNLQNMVRSSLDDWEWAKWGGAVCVRAGRVHCVDFGCFRRPL